MIIQASYTVEMVTRCKACVSKSNRVWVGIERGKSGSDVPVMTDLSPIPESVVELSMCKCNKNGMICSQCENLEEEVNIEEDGYEDIQFSRETIS